MMSRSGVRVQRPGLTAPARLAKAHTAHAGCPGRAVRPAVSIEAEGDGQVLVVGVVCVGRGEDMSSGQAHGDSFPDIVLVGGQEQGHGQNQHELKKRQSRPACWPGLPKRVVIVKGGRLRGGGLCRASAERSSLQAMDEAWGHCPLHHHVLVNPTGPAGIPGAAGDVPVGAAGPDNGPGDRSYDLYQEDPPTTSASTPHTTPLTCVLHAAQSHSECGILRPRVRGGTSSVSG